MQSQAGMRYHVFGETSVWILCGVSVSSCGVGKSEAGKVDRRPDLKGPCLLH